MKRYIIAAVMVLGCGPPPPPCYFAPYQPPPGTCCAPAQGNYCLNDVIYSYYGQPLQSCAALGAYCTQNPQTCVGVAGGACCTFQHPN